MNKYLKFLELESFSSLVLILAAAAAMLLANSSWASAYYSLWRTPLFFSPTVPTMLQLPSFWINEGLMSLFFLLVGLELKRELISGELNKLSRLALPAFAALGGMLLPALLYYFFNHHDPETSKGWAIPVATDLAFALGVLALLNKRIPLGLKLFLMALAIFDDIGGILIIAFYYTEHLAWLSFFYALALVFFGLVLNRMKINRLFPYAIIGLLLWVALLQAGIQATISGVILAFLIPHGREKVSLLARLEGSLHPWVAYLILPLFALANAGFSLSELPKLFSASNTVALGVLAGLFLGKQVGVLGFSWLLIRLGWAKLPRGVNWLELWGVSILCGIGFTMSLFLGTLAFIHSEFYLIEVRLGVFIGSMLSGIIGAVVLFLATHLNRTRGNP